MRLWHVFIKTCREMSRDWWMLGLTLAFAPFFIYLYWLFAHGGSTTYGVIVIDQDQGASLPGGGHLQAGEDISGAIEIKIRENIFRSSLAVDFNLGSKGIIPGPDNDHFFQILSQVPIGRINFSYFPDNSIPGPIVSGSPCFFRQSYVNAVQPMHVPGIIRLYPGITDFGN